MTLHITLDGRSYCLHRPADLESLWEQMAEDGLDADERIPYWVELWPAAILLGKWLSKRQDLLAGTQCLDLGCGLGLCSQVAAACRAKVVGADYEPQALCFARQSVRDTPSPAWVAMDWRTPCFKPQTFPFIFGADILYESRFFAPLLTLWERLLLPGGRIWVTAPDREVSRHFLHATLPEAGWNVHRLAREHISYRAYKNMEVFLWEITSAVNARSRSRSRPG